ncbi:MAG: hypothetical protein ACAF41_14530 [Leptolyngbya sp. BL-A-14]
MLPLLLAVQLQTNASQLRNVVPAVQGSVPSTSVSQEQRLKVIEEELWQVNQRQKESEADQQKLHDRSAPSRVDCYPLFPPVSGYPPGLNTISCY